MQDLTTIDRRTRWVVAVAIASGASLIAAVAVPVGAATPGGNRVALVLPLSLVAGLGLTVLAFARFELFVLVLIALRSSLDTLKISSSSVDATGAVSVLFIGATLVWLIRHEGAFDTPSPARRLVPPFSMLLSAAAVSVVFSSRPLESSLEVVRIGTVVVIVVALARLIRTGSDIRRFLLALIASAAIPLLVAGLEIARGGAGITPLGIGRVDGTFQHPNPFAAYLFLMLILGVALFPHVVSRWKWVLAALIASSGGALVATYARGAWIATVVGLTVVALLQSRRLLWWIGAVVIVLALAVPSVGVRLSDLSESRSPSGAAANSLAWRIGYWEETLARQNNPLLGIGLKEVQSDERLAAAPHNDFVRLYVETGLVGLAAYLWLLGALFREAVATFRRSTPGLSRGLAVAFLATLSGIVVLSTAANVISQLVILWYFATIVTLALAASRAVPDPPPRQA